LPVPVDLPLLPTVSIQGLVQAFLSGRAERTLIAYRGDLRDFAAFTGSSTIEAAATILTTASHGMANSIALAYRTHLIERGLASATIARRLAAIKSIVRLAQTLGVTSWELQVEAVRVQGYRDTRGAGASGFRRLLAQLDGRQDPKGIRDRAVLRLLFDLALRRCEVCRLDLIDVDLDEGKLAVLGKGQREKQRLTMPGPTREAVGAWLGVRPTGGEALFVGLAGYQPGGRLDGSSVYRIIQGLGVKAGFKCWPHSLRHSAITEALNIFNGNVRRVQRFSRHRKLDTLMLYDDQRRDEASDVAARVAEAS
jgi:integrase/recombinase XerC